MNDPKCVLADRRSVIGQDALRIIHPDDPSLVQATLTAALHDDARQTIEFRVLDRRKPGDQVWLEGRVAGLGAGSNRELNIGLREHHHRPARARAVLGHQATHDPLTGLLNRAGLQAQLDAETDRASGWHLIYLDLDRFKPINDLHGHRAGDEVLVKTAQRLLATIRANESAARIGGDEFAIISHVLVGDTDKLVSRLTAAVAAPITLTNGTSVSVTVSVGLATATATTTVDDLLITADHQMYRNKRRAQAASFDMDSGLAVDR